MNTTENPEPRPTLVDAETAARLRNEAGIITTLAISAKGAGDESLSVHLDAIQMADDLMNFHDVASKNFHQSTLNRSWHEDRRDDAEQLKLHHLDMLDRWLHRAPAAEAPSGQRVEIVIQDMPDGMPICEMAFIPQVNSAKPKTPAMELADAFLKAIGQVAEIEDVEHHIIKPQA